MYVEFLRQFYTSRPAFGPGVPFCCLSNCILFLHECDHLCNISLLITGCTVTASICIEGSDNTKYVQQLSKTGNHVTVQM